MNFRPDVTFAETDAVVRDPNDDSDAEEDALVNDYREQVQFDRNGLDDLDSPYPVGPNIGQDIQAQFQAAATPLEFQASLETKFASYSNYCSLFNYLLNSDGPVDLQMLNHHWAWDVIDEFIYQYNSFCSYRQKAVYLDENEEEIRILRENSQVWDCYSVLNVLYSLIQKSNINLQLAAIKRGENPNDFAGEYGCRPLYKTLGYFSIIGLLRVHCLLGDFSLALKTLDDIELNKKATFARVMAADFATYYFVGFCYIMLRRYADAVRMFSHILIYISRTKNFQKNSQYDTNSISKKNDQMYALVAICVAFQPTRLDDTIHTALLERYGDDFMRMQRGGPESLPVFEKLFRAACPKFISPSPPDFDNPQVNVDPVDHHCAVFMEEVKIAMWSPAVKSYLRLYSTMDVGKLAGFLEIDPLELRSWLMVCKQRSRQVRWTEDGLLDGEIVNTSDLDFALQGDLIHISEAKVGRRLIDWYIRNLSRTY